MDQEQRGGSGGGFCGRTRRQFLWEAGGGFASVALAALAALLGTDGFFAKQAVAADGKTPWRQPLALRPPHFAPKAKSVIFLYMYGGPSHIDTFDYKPGLVGMDNKTVDVKTFGRGGHKNQGRIVEPRWAFQQYGQSGKWVMLQMNTGKILSGSPCLGSWLNYGLGSANENLPGFVVMLDPRGGPISGPKNWSSGFMPASFQATTIAATDTPILDLNRPADLSKETQRRLLDALQSYNAEHAQSQGDNSNLAARIASYELAYKMQAAAPEATDLAREPDHVRALYGLNDDRTRVFGRQCLMARRLVERGVRFVQLYSGGAHNDANWDAHGDLVANHTLHAGETDKPIAGLIQDLKQRGLLDSTLIVWGGEFGRQPTAEYAKGTGRDHNAYGFTMWLAGGGVKGGVSVGQTDELGGRAVTDPFHVKHLHATILHQMGLDPNRLSFFYAGLNQKLVGVEGAEPIKKII